MDLYIVVRTGVYDQGVFAVYDSLEGALAGMDEAKKLENDNYHDFEIRKYKLNEPKNTQGHYYCGE